MRAEASRELLAPREDVWRFAADPHRLPDWWPGIGGVDPDRRGVARGARWQVHRAAQPTLFRRGLGEELLIVREVDPPALLAWHLTASRLDVQLRLAAGEPGRTRAVLTVESPLLLGFRRSLPRLALARLYDLCQTAAQ